MEKNLYWQVAFWKWEGGSGKGEQSCSSPLEGEAMWGGEEDCS